MTQNPWTRKSAWSDADIAAATEAYELEQLEQDMETAAVEYWAAEQERREEREELHGKLLGARKRRTKLDAVLAKIARAVWCAEQPGGDAEDAAVLGAQRDRILDELAGLDAEVLRLSAKLDATNAPGELPWWLDLGDIPPQRPAA